MTAEAVQPSPGPVPDGERERYWRSNLVGVASLAFATVFGVQLFQPLFPTFLHHELGITDVRELAFWSGLSTAVAPVGAALAGPLWGIAGDRYGRKPFLARAVGAGAIFVVVLGLAQNIGQVIVFRVILGLTAGVNSPALALVAAETPRRHLSRALGIMATARSLGQTAGPAIGGLLASVLPLRAVFAVAGMVLVVALAPLLRVHETKLPVRGAPRASLRAALRSSGPAARQAIFAIIASQALVFLALAGGQQLILVRLVALDPDRAAIASGLAFAALSLCSAVAGVFYPRLLPMLGHRKLAIVAVLVLGLAIAAAGQAASAPVLIAAAALMGAGYGVSNPLNNSMLGLEMPAGVAGTIFGLSQSAQQLGTAAGALGSGILAVALGPQATLEIIAVAAVPAAVVVSVWGREPES